MKLFHCPNTCSLASHIALHEFGIPFDKEIISIFDGAQRRPEYLSRVPAGKVPALDVDGRILTENVAILLHVADHASDRRLLPVEPVARAEHISRLAWFSSTPHISFRRMMRPMLFCQEAECEQGISSSGRADFLLNMRELDQILSGRDWICGTEFSVCDAYAMVFYNWCSFAKLDLGAFAGLNRWAGRMLDRHAVCDALRADGILDRIAESLALASREAVLAPITSIPDQSPVSAPIETSYPAAAPPQGPVQLRTRS